MLHTRPAILKTPKKIYSFRNDSTFFRNLMTAPKSSVAPPASTAVMAKALSLPTNIFKCYELRSVGFCSSAHVEMNGVILRQTDAASPAVVILLGGNKQQSGEQTAAQTRLSALITRHLAKKYAGINKGEGGMLINAVCFSAVDCEETEKRQRVGGPLRRKTQVKIMTGRETQLHCSLWQEIHHQQPAPADFKNRRRSAEPPSSHRST